MATIGLDNLVYTVMKDEKLETYDTVKQVPEIKMAKISPKSEIVKDYADDQQVTAIQCLTGIEFTVENTDIDSAVLADWHGHTVDAKGVLIKKSSDKAPYIALGFRSLKADGKYRYKWLYKCVASLGDEELKTKGEKPELQSKTTTFSCIPRKRDKQWQSSVDDGESGLATEVIANWFKAPYGETSK